MAEQENITPPYYSNCLIECIKAKIRNPKIKITYLPPHLNEIFCPHFMWSDGKYDYDFGVNGHIPLCRVLWFKGCIRRRKLGFNRRWKRAAIIAYYKRKLQKVKGGLTLEKVKKCCANCAYGIVRKKVSENAPNVICAKKSDFEKGRFYLSGDECKCRNWQEMRSDNG